MSVRRFDRGEYRKAKKDEATGFLRAEGYLTRTGVFAYLKADGTIQNELRLPEEVFAPESLQSFALAPITLEHPPEFLTAENATKYQVGMTGETVEPVDNRLVRSMLSITAAQAVKAVESGDNAEISCGYLCDLIFTPGEYNGQRYDAVQTNIRGNHVALVSEGRAGPEARVRLDAKLNDAVQLPGDAARHDKGGRTVKVKIRGIEFDVPDQAAQALEAERADTAKSVDTAKAVAETLEKELEKTKAKADTLADDVKKLEQAKKDAADPAKMRDAIKARVELEKVAAKAKVEKADALADGELKAAIVSKVLERKVDGKSADYVQACYELALEKLVSKSDESDDDTEALKAALRDDNKDGRDTTEDLDAKKKKFHKDRAEAWKKPLAFSKDAVLARK